MPAWVGRQYVATLAFTSSGLAVNFGIQAGSFLVVNDGAGAIFMDFTSHTSILATTTGGSFKLASGENVRIAATVERNTWVGFNAACSSGGTASVRVLALAG